jgi:hypothetical protein
MAIHMNREFVQIKGACHCGNIRFVLRWPEPAAEISVRKCGCTFCCKHAGAWTSHRRSKLEVEVGDLASVSKYHFGTKTADFYICSNCGVVPFVTSEIDAHDYAVVNVNAFDDVANISLVSTSTDFEGENLDNRLERRKRNWIPHVRISISAR